MLPNPLSENICSTVESKPQPPVPTVSRQCFKLEFANALIIFWNLVGWQLQSDLSHFPEAWKSIYSVAYSGPEISSLSWVSIFQFSNWMRSQWYHDLMTSSKLFLLKWQEPKYISIFTFQQVFVISLRYELTLTKSAQKLPNCRILIYQEVIRSKTF